jgi:hypothetical protein
MKRSGQQACTLNGEREAGFDQSFYGKDVSDSNEHPALPRIPGSRIVAYEGIGQSEIAIPLERIIFDLKTQRFKNFKDYL